MQNLDLSKRYLVTNEMKINLAVLGSLVMDMIVGQIRGPNIITKHNSSTLEG
jgi:hypothetical protein